MPIVESAYKPPFLFRNGFVSTVYSGLARRVNGLIQERERITLSDNDFLDLDWSYTKDTTNKVIVMLHGLEGNGQRPYMTGVAKLFNTHGVDAVCVNFRGCSGEPNLKYRSYHSGATEDLVDIINHLIDSKHYSEIYFHGISLGANMVLKYIGERRDVPTQIKGVVAVSVPCDLHGSCKELHTFKNRLYHNNFKKYLVNRLKIKQTQHTDRLSVKEINSINTLIDFDNIYTSRAHGFKDALDYYTQCSSLQFLPNIKIPTLIINALNDSFLSPECYPVKEAKANSYLHLEMPNHGGHVGFIQLKSYYYNEKRALEFFGINQD
ncbi:alpha/beta fold hydrolase [Flavobacteriaceae bacterium S0825]|uniref:YheT family hydrolase n=1 Tax=Gaetbulibacter sp. S0825 TaxID=2720084 RepID=UPI00143133D6|nr:alpha/beta fold hydrolase [Gaetbulibacter sp. S0825]MCK0109532.1 alpha/beta fold hydrolase [Flavobacteriaceae bacterium S0825]NIX65166.1 alpha/beta fold hydrolase [Gaetbulibacter sp. S0825]